MQKSILQSLGLGSAKNGQTIVSIIPFSYSIIVVSPEISCIIWTVICWTDKCVAGCCVQGRIITYHPLCFLIPDGKFAINTFIERPGSNSTWLLFVVSIKFRHFRMCPFVAWLTISTTNNLDLIGALCN